MNKLILEQKVKELVAKETAVRIEKLTLETYLLKDLGVDGYDALELLEKYWEVFQVDLSQFQFSKHFGPEGGPKLFLSSDEPQLEPLTIQDVVDGVKARELK